MHSPRTKRLLTAARLARERAERMGLAADAAAASGADINTIAERVWRLRARSLLSHATWSAGRDLGATCHCDCDCQCHDDLPGACIGCCDPANRGGE